MGGFDANFLEAGVSSSPVSPGPRILVVEDDAQMSEVIVASLRHWLRTTRAVVVPVLTGQHALTLLRDRNFDLVILDISLPDIGGIEILREMRRMPEHEETAVVVLTGLNEQEIIEQAFDLVVEDFIFKPYQMVQLRARVVKIIRAISTEQSGGQAVKLVAEAAGSLDKIIWTFDPATGRYTSCTGAVRRILGYAAEHIMLEPRLWNERIHPDDIARRQQAMVDGVSKSKEVSYRVCTPNQPEIVVNEEIRILANSSDRAMLIVGVTAITSHSGTQTSDNAASWDMEQIFRSSPMLLFSCGSNGEVLRANPAFLPLTGWQPEEIVGRKWNELIHRDDLFSCGDAIGRVLRGVPVDHVPGRMLKKDGTYTKFSWFAGASPGNGTFFGAGVEMEVVRSRPGGGSTYSTEAVSTEDHSLLFALPHGILLFAEDGTIMDWNDVACGYFGLAAMPPRGTRIADIFVKPGDHAHFEAAIASAKSGNRSEFVSEISASYGGTLPVEVCVTAHAGNAGMVFVAFIRDISSQVSQESQLRLLSAAMAGMEESVVITDADLDAPGPRILFVNQSFARMTGYDAHEVLGRNPRFMQGPRTDRTVLDRLRSQLRAGESFEGETYNYRKDGGEFLLHWHITPVRDCTGKVTHFIALQTDLSQRRRFEEELLQSRKLRALGEILGGLAHEFNNLLQPMLVQLDLLAKAPAVPTEVEQLLQPVHDSALHATELCRRVLGMSRKSSDDVESIAADHTVASTLDVFRSSLDRRIELDVELGANDHFVRAAKTQLHQIVLNLCLNARDSLIERCEGEPLGAYVPHLLVRTRHVAARRPMRDESEQTAAIDCVCIIVSDNGGGMAAEVRERVFEPFFTTKKGARGTGLGLSGVWSMLEEIGGWVELSSRLGEGSVFEVFIPVVPAPDGAKIDDNLKTPTADCDVRRQRVLIVEDNPMVSRSFVNLLRAEGHTVEACGDGAAAWALLRERHTEFDLVLSDLNMPRLTGATLASLMLSLPYAGRLILISGYVTDADRHMLESAGSPEILQKPVAPEKLLAAVNGRKS